MRTRVAQYEAQQSSTAVGSGEKTLDSSERALEIRQSIAVRAYQLFESRGRVDGYDLEDWLQAESEVLLPISAKTYEFEDEWITRAQLPRSKTDDLDVKVDPKQITISD